MARPIEELREERLRKLEQIRELGINPYPSSCGRCHSAAEAFELEGETVSVAGRIAAIRGHGKIIFFDLRDASGKIQLVFKAEKIKGKNAKLLGLLDIGDFIDARGGVFKTDAGEVSVLVEDFHLLTKSILPIPSKWHGLKDIEERYRQRYLDLLMNEEVRGAFQTRAEITNLLRKFLDGRGFMEVKTPALQPLYGGASARPFITHHNALGIDLFLRISDELYLKRLIVGGFEKVYELCTDFRNEGIDRWHNPEFTMLEFYWAYADYNDLMRLTEEMLSSIVKEVCGGYKIDYAGSKIDFKPPWKRLSFQKAVLDCCGIDIDEAKSLADLKAVLGKRKVKADLGGIRDLVGAWDELFKTLVRPQITDPTFLIDCPVAMRPLAKKHRKDSSKVENMQLVVAGAELVNAYTELNDPQEQRARWEEDMSRAKAGVEEFQVVDEDYIEALEYGMPPTAGWGLGVDRLVAILTNQHSLKDVILFPALRPR